MNSFDLAINTVSANFAASPIGGIRETQEMLEFCAANGVGAEIEIIPAGKTNVKGVHT